jgi:hypothetical protein
MSEPIEEKVKESLFGPKKRTIPLENQGITYDENTGLVRDMTSEEAEAHIRRKFGLPQVKDSESS